MILTLYNLQSHFHLKDKVKGDIVDHVLAREIENEKDCTIFIHNALGLKY